MTGSLSLRFGMIWQRSIMAWPAGFKKLLQCTNIFQINHATNLLYRTSSRLSAQGTTKPSSPSGGYGPSGDISDVSVSNLPIYGSEPQDSTAAGSDREMKALAKRFGVDYSETEKYKVTATPRENETSHLTPFMTPSQLAERRREVPERPFDGRRTTLKEDWEHFVKWFKRTFYELHYWFEMKLVQDGRRLLLRNSLTSWYITNFNTEIAVALWVLQLRGAVRYKNQEEWYRGSHRKFPVRQQMEETVEAVDLSGTDISYNGLSNLELLNDMTELRLADCPHVDDFCLSKLHEFSGKLVYLDISRCPLVTERGLSSLHNVRSLQVVKMEEMPNVKYKELVALMMEEVMPRCKFEGVDYVEKAAKLGIKMDLSALENKDVKLLDKPTKKVEEKEEGKQQQEATAAA
ncbi:ATP5SL [Branchiostoma lanceolatum]|uniref:Distal membrane-arm assembly complex protein 2 n=1 Tax=Branchiostoma lanceolatum TaxID=7740 RepID=A0A8J9ZTZ0_BRALA|nr:ATP5SL [Branchiostoma lanceolatum]